MKGEISLPKSVNFNTRRNKTMSLDFSRMSANANNPTARKDIGRWLDQTFKVPNDVTNGKLYYEGIMGRTPLQILSNISQIPNGIPNPKGGIYSPAKFYRITVFFKQNAYDVILEDIGLSWGQHKGMYNGKVVNAYMGYVVAGIIPAKLNPNNLEEMELMLMP
jgi:hypothetical protein